jgi:hypothetical protein
MRHRVRAVWFALSLAVALLAAMTVALAEAPDIASSRPVVDPRPVGLAAAGSTSSTVYLPVVMFHEVITWGLPNAGFEAQPPPEGLHWCHKFPVGEAPTFEYIENIFAPPFWTFWFRHKPDLWDQPEGRIDSDPFRVHSGEQDYHYFTFWRKHDAGLYQTVTGLEPDTWVSFQAYGHAWCDGSDENPSYCGPYDMKLFVGVDPNAGTDPLSEDVVWAEAWAQGTYSLIGPAMAQVGQDGRVTLFLRSQAQWKLKHNDVYWDDAVLLVFR